MKISVIVSVNSKGNNTLINSIDRIVSSFVRQDIISTVETEEKSDSLLSIDDYEIIIENSLSGEEYNIVLEKISSFSQFKLLNSDVTSNEGNRFLSTAVNNCSGDYIIFANSDYSYNSNYLSNVIASLDVDGINCVFGDVVLDNSYEIGNESELLKELNFKSVKGNLGISDSSVISRDVLDFDHLFFIDNFAVSRSWLQNKIEEKSLYSLQTSHILNNLECDTVFFSKDVVATFIINEDFNFSNYMKFIGEETATAFIANADEKFSISAYIPLINKNIYHSFVLGLFGKVTISSFLLMHFFAFLFVMDIFFFSGLFSSSSPWVFLLFCAICAYSSFGKILHVSEEFDKLELFKLKYFGNVNYYISFFKVMFKDKSFVITRPYF